MRGFDDDEREAIREGLVEAAEAHFLSVGPRETTIAALTDEVGIGTRTFYDFFECKAALFMEVFRRLGREQVEAVLEAVEPVEDGQEGVRLLFRTYTAWLEDHPIIQKFSSDVEQRRFRRSLPADEFAAAERKRDELLATPVRRWQANGSLRDDVPALAIVELLEPLLLLAVTTDEYDEAYRNTRDRFIETIARGVATD